MSEPTASQQVKALYHKNGHGKTLKDFAIEISVNGTITEKKLVNDWFSNKIPTPRKKKVRINNKKAATPEPQRKAPVAKKR